MRSGSGRRERERRATPLGLFCGRVAPWGLYHGPRSFSCCFPPSLARLRRRNRRAGQAAGGAYVLMRRRRRLRYELRAPYGRDACSRVRRSDRVSAARGRNSDAVPAVLHRLRLMMRGRDHTPWLNTYRTKQQSCSIIQQRCRGSLLNFFRLLDLYSYS